MQNLSPIIEVDELMQISENQNLRIFDVRTGSNAKENYIKNKPCMRYILNKRENGKNNRNCSPQSNPRNIGFILKRHLAKRKQANKNRERTGKKDHQKTDNQPGYCDGQ